MRKVRAKCRTLGSRMRLCTVWIKTLTAVMEDRTSRYDHRCSVNSKADAVWVSMSMKLIDFSI